MLPTSIDTQADLDAVREYINAAPTPEERQRRKRELFRALYSQRPKSLRTLFYDFPPRTPQP